MRLLYGRRHRDVANSDFRGTYVAKVSQEVAVREARPARDARGAVSDFRDDRVGEFPHLGRIVDEDVGNVTLSGPSRRSPTLDRGPLDALQ